MCQFENLKVESTKCLSVRAESRTRQALLLYCSQFLVFYLCIKTQPLFSQQKPAQEDDIKKEIIFDGKRYRTYSNWLSFGGGPAIKEKSKSTQFAADISYNFHIKKEYFQVGVTVSGDKFGVNNNILWHGAYGKRKETTKYCWSTWGGVSYASYYPYVDSLNGYLRKTTTSPGIYVATQFIGKLKYDIGLGPSAFFSYYADKQYIVGLRIDVFFSGSYRGKEE
ncbi:MAG: hypothetical protein J0M08_01590 [Bacteroidetes bacterium]|nr:hypothetical protein [Bacteroidota bacterium]